MLGTLLGVALLTSQCIGTDLSASAMWENVQDVSSNAFAKSKKFVESAAITVENIDYNKIYKDAKSTLHNAQTKIANKFNNYHFQFNSLTQIAGISLTNKQTKQISHLINRLDTELNKSTNAIVICVICQLMMRVLIYTTNYTMSYIDCVI